MHAVVYNGIQWYTVVYNGIQWYTIVYNGVLWYTIVYVYIHVCSLHYYNMLVFLRSCEMAATSLPSGNEGEVPGITKSEVAVCLSEKEEEQMMADDIVSSLYSAVECWLKMWEIGRREVSVCVCVCVKE